MAGIFAVSFTCLLALFGVAEGRLGNGAQVATGHMSAEQLRAAMLDELMGALGEGNRVTEGRLQAIEEALRPMYRSLHKNEHDHLDHAGVRYALHRLFVLRHGMFIKGLEPGGAGWTAGASPTEVLDDRVPAFVQSLFEQRLDGRGLGLHEVAILAATLEHLIHDEAVKTLEVAYKSGGLPVDGRLSDEQAADVIDTYMVIFLMGINATESFENIQKQKKMINKVYPSWPESAQFTRQVQKEVAAANAADTGFAGGTLAFNATARVVEEVMERYGRWQDSECKSLKSALMDLEDRSTGRVLLKDFYGSAKGGAWQFTESVAYLTSLGALDNTSAQRQSVIIPNYINSHSNCLASSSMFSVCCLNECEPLLGHLEREVGAPDASPSRVLELVANLPSSTIKAPREISAEMRGLLDDIAKEHGGKVPLHGRLFGQWLHHAYPRECPFPHRSGSTNPMTADEWIAENGKNNLASDDEMQDHIDAGNSTNATSTAAHAEPTPLMWTVEEELVITSTAAPTLGSRRMRSRLLSSFMFLAAIASVIVTLWSNVKSAAKAFGPKGGVLPFAGKAHLC